VRNNWRSGLELCFDCGSFSLGELATGAVIACAPWWAGLWCYRRSRMTTAHASAYAAAAFTLYGLAIVVGCVTVFAI